MEDVELSYVDVQRVLALLEHAPEKRVFYDDGELQVTAVRVASQVLKPLLAVSAEAQLMRSPAVGIFRPYASLRTGAHLQAGDVLGNIETMDLSTPITAGIACRVNKILMEAGSFVAFGQPLVALIKE